MQAPARVRLNPSSLPLLLILAALLVLAAPGGALAKVTGWTGGGGTDNWSDAGNWNNGVPVSGDGVMFMPVSGSSTMDIAGLTLNVLDMAGFSGILHLNQSLAVIDAMVVDGDVMVNTSLAVAGYVDLYSTGTVNLFASLSVGDAFTCYGGLAGNGHNIDVVGSLVVYPSGYMDITGGSLTVANDLTINGMFVADVASVDVAGRIEGGPAGTLQAINATVTAQGRVLLDAMPMADMTGGSLLLGPWCDALRVGFAHMLGSVTVQGNSPSWLVDMTTPPAGSWSGITGTLMVTQGTLDLRNADLVVMGPTLVSSAGTIRAPSITSGHTHEFVGGMTIEGTFLATSPGTTLKFGDGSTVDVNATGTFFVYGGGGGGRIQIMNTTATTRWNLDYDPTTTTYIRNAEIQWGDANPALTVHSCVDAGNNIDFIFVEPDIDAVPAALAFGTIAVGTTVHDTVAVLNVGSDSLHVSSITNSLAEFVPSPTGPFVLLPGDTQLVAVSFHPLTVATFIDSLVITSDDPDEGIFKVPLSGSGATPDLIAQSIGVSVTELMSGTDSVFASYTVRNGGGIAAPPFRYSLRISADATIDTDDLILASNDYTGSLLPGWNASTSEWYTLPKAAPRGHVYLGLIADDLDQVIESDEGNNTYALPFTYHVPLIHSVIDVPFDQGGSVFLSWYASPRDPLGDITEYTLWRTIDVPPAGAAVIEGAGSWRDDLEGRVIRVEKSPAGPVFWEHIATHGAFRRDAYGMALPSLFDSTGAGFAYQYFQVIAHTAYPDTFYLSAVESGYSVDNLAPAAPLGLAGEQTEPEGMQLTWDANSEADLSHYAVYRGADAGFVPGPGNRIGEPPEPGLFDDQWLWDGGFYYKVTAVDVHGNESPVATLAPDFVVGVGPSGPPRANALLQNHPNPFAATTTIAFDLAREADVSIRIYDVQGRLVRTLLDGHRGADRHTVDWEGLDDRGNPVAGGVYFYRITAGSFVQVKKLIVIR